MASAAMKAVAISTLLLAFAEGAKLEVTPVQKVISLLGDLYQKVAAEGEKDAAQYDKFACFCKEQATEKQLAIEKSTKKLAANKATQEKLDETITELTNEVSNLKRSISNEKDNIEKLTAKRAKTHDAYLAESDDVAGAISDSQDAIAAIESKLSTQEKDWNDDLDYKKLGLLQTALAKRSAAKEATAFLSQATLSATNRGYDATDAILSSLKKFVSQFKSQAADVDSDEGKSKDLSDRAVLGSKNTIKFADKMRKEKEEQITSLTAELEASKEDSIQENRAMESDKAFLKELTAQCEEKAKLFDQHSKTRSAELRALNSATEELKKGTPPGGAVGKMAELAKNSRTAKRHVAVSFLQLSREAGQKAAAIKKAYALLDDAVANTDSDALSSLTMRMQVAGDHFVKVRRLVKDMIEKLEADAKSEASKKAFCDREIAEGVKNRDKGQADIEEAKAEITKTTANKVSLEEDVAQLTDQIAEIEKAIGEETELRNDEKNDNEQTVATAKEAASATDTAFSTLQKFYGNALLQWTPKNADRSGKTVEDRAPEVFQDTYHGAQDDAKGILGILEVCKADFERVDKVTTREEKEAQKAFDTMLAENNKDIATKKSIIKAKQDQITNDKATLADEQENLEDATDLFDTGTTALEKMKSHCDLEGEPYEDRTKARKEEIASLKEAMEILDDWKTTK